MTSLTILGRRWFDRINGNTYFSAKALIDGKPAGEIRFQYGYGNQYEHEMFAKLQQDGLLADVERYAHGLESPWRWCERNKITYHAEVTDVARKRDL